MFLEILWKTYQSKTWNYNVFFLPNTDFFCRVGSKDLFNDSFNMDEDLDSLNIDENHRYYVAILVKSLCLLEKLPYALDVSSKHTFVNYYIINLQFLGNSKRNASLTHTHNSKINPTCYRFC